MCVDCVCVSGEESLRAPHGSEMCWRVERSVKRRREERDGDKARREQRGTGAEVFGEASGVERETRFVPVGRGVGIFREEEGGNRVGRRALIEIESVERGAR